MKTLLLLTYYFPPTAAVAVHRMLGLARHLPKFGWRVVVVAPPRVPCEPYDESLLEQVPQDTTVVRIPFPTGLWGKVTGRFVHQESWLPRAWSACRKIITEHSPDAYMTSSPPPCLHFLGLYMKRQTNLPWVACLRDPWKVNNRGLDAMRWIHRLGLRYEASVMERADAVVANTPRNLAGLQAAYPEDADKMTVITNGYDPERFPDKVNLPRTGDPLTLLHAGEMYSGRDPRPLLDAVKSLREGGASNLDLHFMGRTADANFDIMGEARQRNLEDAVRVTDHVAHKEAIERMTQAGILVLIHSPGTKIGVPAKLYEYLGARRPILALAEEDSDIAWVLQASGVPHRLVPTHDAEQIKRAVVELSAEATRETPPQPSNGIRSFTREHMAYEFAQTLDGIVPGVKLFREARHGTRSVPATVRHS